MKITYVRSYRSKKGTPTFVYNVEGTKEELKTYKDSQGTYYREDSETKKALFFTARYVGEEGTLLITSNGNCVPDMSEFDKQASLAAQYGGNLGEQLAQQGMEKLK
jgi:hypothetical protein